MDSFTLFYMLRGDVVNGMPIVKDVEPVKRLDDVPVACKMVDFECRVWWKSGELMNFIGLSVDGIYKARGPSDRAYVPFNVDVSKFLVGIHLLVERFQQCYLGSKNSTRHPSGRRRRCRRFRRRRGGGEIEKKEKMEMREMKEKN